MLTPTADRRHLHHGDAGPDVRAYQRMLARTLKGMGLRSLNRQGGLYGDGTLKDTLILQHRSRLSATGVVDAATWSLVNPQMRARERWLLRRRTPPPAPLGDRIAHWLNVMWALQLSYYTQARPGARALPYPWKAGADCSSSYLLAVSLALGVPYDGYGNTGSVWSTYAYVAEGDVQNGDAALYGHGGVTSHMQGVVDASLKPSPMTIGFGHAPGTRAPANYWSSAFMGYRRRRS